jgi:hypothetical protein
VPFSYGTLYALRSIGFVGGGWQSSSCWLVYCRRCRLPHSLRVYAKRIPVQWTLEHERICLLASCGHYHRFFYFVTLLVRGLKVVRSNFHLRSTCPTETMRQETRRVQLRLVCLNLYEYCCTSRFLEFELIIKQSDLYCFSHSVRHYHHLTVDVELPLSGEGCWKSMQGSQTHYHHLAVIAFVRYHPRAP